MILLTFLQKNPVLITNLRNDLKKECENKFGEVRKVIVFDVSMFPTRLTNIESKVGFAGTF